MWIPPVRCDGPSRRDTRLGGRRRRHTGFRRQASLPRRRPRRTRARQGRRLGRHPHQDRTREGRQVDRPRPLWRSRRCAVRRDGENGERETSLDRQGRRRRSDQLSRERWLPRVHRRRLGAAFNQRHARGRRTPLLPRAPGRRDIRREEGACRDDLLLHTIDCIDPPLLQRQKDFPW